MTKHILCAVDLTHLDDDAVNVRKAAELAGFYGASLSVITVLPDYGMPIVSSFFQKDAMVEAAKLADKHLREFLSDTLPGQEVQAILEIGNVYEKILERAKKEGVDLIVVGANKPDLANRLQGPNSARVARYAPCSVLVARA